MISAAKHPKRVEEEEKKMNPVQLIVRLPRDLRAYLKTFLIGVRHPIIFRIESLSNRLQDHMAGNHWEVEQWSIRGDGDGGFLCRPDNTPDRPGHLNSWHNLALAHPVQANPVEVHTAVALIAEEFVRPRLNDDMVSYTNEHNVLTIESRCCAKHRVPISLQVDWDHYDADNVVAGHELALSMVKHNDSDNGNYYLGTIPLAYGGDRKPRYQPHRLLTLFEDHLNRLPAARQLVERVLTHWTPCSDDPYDCVADDFDLVGDAVANLEYNGDSEDSGDDDVPPLVLGGGVPLNRLPAANMEIVLDAVADSSDDSDDDDVPPPLVDSDDDDGDVYAEYADLTSCYPMQV